MIRVVKVNKAGYRGSLFNSCSYSKVLLMPNFLHENILVSTIGLCFFPSLLTHSSCTYKAFMSFYFELEFFVDVFLLQGRLWAQNNKGNVAIFVSKQQLTQCLKFAMKSINQFKPNLGSSNGGFQYTIIGCIPPEPAVFLICGYRCGSSPLTQREGNFPGAKIPQALTTPTGPFGP